MNVGIFPFQGRCNVTEIIIKEMITCLFLNG